MRYAMVIDPTQCLGCQACVAACTEEHDTPFWSGNYRTHVEDLVGGSYPDLSRQFLPRLCMQCEDAPCVAVCPSGASHHVAGGAVVVDQDRCLGCKACIEACPYDARYVYSAADILEAQKDYGPGVKQISAHVDKCDLCVDRVAAGLEPACVATCPGEARLFGDLDDAGSKVAKLVASGRAKPLAAGLGTHPRVFYAK